MVKTQLDLELWDAIVDIEVLMDEIKNELTGQGITSYDKEMMLDKLNEVFPEIQKVATNSEI